MSACRVNPLSKRGIEWCLVVPVLSAILPIGSEVQTVVKPSASANDGLCHSMNRQIQDEARCCSCPRCCAASSVAKIVVPNSSPPGHSPKCGNIDSGIASEACELVSVKALGIRSAPLVAQSETERELRLYTPFVLNEEARLPSIYWQRQGPPTIPCRSREN